MRIATWLFWISTTACCLSGCTSNPSPGGDQGTLPDLGSTDGTDTGSIQVTEDIRADTTWTAARPYLLTRHIFVESGTLTIEPGALIMGQQGSSLVVTRGGRIDANGTATQPIVFTSSQAVGTRRPGNWGGVVLLGNAPVNDPSPLQVEGFPATESRVGYGGSNPAHDCGRLHYVRIEFAGFELSPNREINGLTLGGCGTATDIDYVQVHRGADDGVEMFGGTAGLRHILITLPDDDGLDWDYGWRGRGQFIIVQQSPNAGDNGIEADNHPDPDHTLMPISSPTLYNVTLIGSNADPQGGTSPAFKRQTGILFRRGTAGGIYNMIMAYFADFPIDITNPDTVARTTAPYNDLFVRNSIFFDNGNQDTWNDAGTDTKEGAGFNEGTYFKNEPTNAPLVGVDPQLTSALSTSAPNFRPQTGSAAFTTNNAATPPDDGFFDTTATYIGAIGTTDWTTGWTAFPTN